MDTNQRARACRGRSKVSAKSGPAAARVLLTFAVFAAFAPPWGAAIADPVPQNLDVPVLTEGFEGGFPGAAWSANDTNASSGSDTWAASPYRAASGASSVWSAGNGSQLAVWDAGAIPPVNVTNATNLTIFSEDFEDGTFDVNWTASDEDANTSGNDTWGVSAARAYTGAASIWAAQIGYNDELLDDNVNVTSYDNYQVSYVWRSVDLSNISNDTEILLEYWWWLDSESCCDYLYSGYVDGNGWNLLTFDSGTSNGWTQGSVSIPNTALQVGFLFTTDYSVLYEGAYIDNVSLIAVPPPPPGQPAGPFAEDFEPGNASRNWSVGDEDSYQGKDYWGVSAARAHSGAASLWSAQVGRNSNWGVPNANVPAYDDGMWALAWRPIVNANLSGFPSATFSFWYWLDSETGFDYLSAVYYNDTMGWVVLSSWDGSSGGWVFASFAVPNDTTRVGFLFSTDGSVIYEGAYVDDVELYATRDDPNQALRTYDTSMNATMTRAVAVSPYALAFLEYSYWLETDSGNDTLEAMVLTGTTWMSLDRRSGNSSSWQTLTFGIPTDTTRIGFRFVTDGAGHSEGAYLDDIRVWGAVFPVNCTANVAVFAGMERVTPFLYTVQAADGLRPYSYAWNFSDGNTSVAASPSRTFSGVGTYSANVTVTDALGQTCLARAPDVGVTHDITTVSVAPTAGTVVEGSSVTVDGADARGHPIDFSWTLAPPECGVLSTATGPSVTFSVAQTAGGVACTVTASTGGVQAQANFGVIHDSSVLILTSAATDLNEGQSLPIFAVDRYGHALVFGWSSSCGRVTPMTGSSTTFTADELGGQVCTVTATSLMGNASTVVAVLHDTRSLTIAPGFATLLEGANQTFSVVDAFLHPTSAEWSVSPSSCGLFSLSPASVTIFTTSEDAGGTTCTVTATAGAGLRSVEVTVRHHFGDAVLSPTAVTLIEGGAQAFSALDSYGHPFEVTWDLVPVTCGALSVELGTAVTLTAGDKLGAVTCTLRATSASVSLEAVVTVTHGPPAALQASANGTLAVEGGSVSLTAAVLDDAGHALAGLAIGWQASCGLMDDDTGAANTLRISTDAGGTTCNVTASQGALSRTLSIEVRHAGPFTVAVTHAGDPGGPQTFTATVKDRHGHTIPDATVRWTATCGALTTATGASTTFTPPGDLGGSTCRVTATSAVGTSTSEVARTVTTGMSLLIPLALVVAIGGAVGLLLVVRKRKAKDGDEGKPGDEGKDEGSSP